MAFSASNLFSQERDLLHIYLCMHANYQRLSHTYASRIHLKSDEKAASP